MNPYETLKLDQTATADEIARAYKRAATATHPDNRETGDEEKFKAVARAYRILGDETTREIYDKTGVVMGDDPLAEQAIMLIVDVVGDIVTSGHSVDLIFDIRIAIKTLQGNTERAITRIERFVEQISARWSGADLVRRSILLNLEGKATSLRHQTNVHRKAAEAII